MREVGLGQQRIFADDVHAADAAAQDVLDHVGRAHALFGGRLRAPFGGELLQHLGDVALVAGQRVGDAAGVARALHVVLPAQRRDPVADPADLPGQQRQVEQRRRVGRAVGVLGHAHAPDQAGIARALVRRIRRRVGEGRADEQLGRHAGDHLHVLRRVVVQFRAPGLEALRPLRDEGFVGQARVQDRPRHPVQHGHVGARIVAQPEIGVVAHLDPLGVEHDQLRPAVDRLAHPAGRDGVVRGRVRADHEEAVGRLVVGIRVGGRAAAELREHRLDRGRVAEPRAVVDVVRAHHGAREFLQQVVVLVGRLGRGERAERAAVLREALGDEVQRLVPRRGFEPARAPDQRRRQPVRVVHERRPEAPLDAEQPARRAVAGVVVDAGDAPLGIRRDQDPAADAAVGADRRDRPLAGRFPLRGERERRAGGDAGAAGGAGRFAQRLVGEGRDARRVAGAGDPDRADVLAVAASRDAAPAEDAVGRVEIVEMVGRVRRLVNPLVPAPGIRAVRARVPRQFVAGRCAVAPHRRRQLQYAAPRRHGRFRIGADDQPLGDGRRAGRRQPAPALDLDQAGAAGPQRRPVRVLAEVRQINPRRQHRIQHRRPRSRIAADPVNCDRNSPSSHRTLPHRCYPSRPVQRRAPLRWLRTGAHPRSPGGSRKGASGVFGPCRAKLRGSRYHPPRGWRS